MMDGAQLRAARKALKLTQAELGEALGLSRGHVCEMERSRKDIERRTEMAMELLAIKARPRIAFTITAATPIHNPAQIGEGA